ncbi:NAD(P)H-dependent D-xylose reductase (XR) [Tulasnella sp. UAMH 9824]|nr:NAD(P)H-dependent D-xylose reductase (XR) [Tulasnella sp. UAMH 9824]
MPIPLVNFQEGLCRNRDVYAALKAGYRLVDGASDYDDKKEAGDGLKRAIAEGIVKRKDVFVMSNAKVEHHP